jgi:hydroxyacylglutathione hydrolase
MIIETLTVNPFAENTYILIQDGKALIVDPGFFYQAEMDQLHRLLQTHQAKPVAIVLTHAHIDHIIGIPLVQKVWPHLPIYRHIDEKYNWDQLATTAARYGVKVSAIPDTCIDLEPGSNIDIHGFEMEIRHVPGHAPGHLVFYLAQDNALIAGDTLFQGSIGRTDLHQGDFDLLDRSIKQQIYTLPSETIVYPGHGAPTSVADEMYTNPYVRLNR